MNKLKLTGKQIRAIGYASIKVPQGYADERIATQR
jgi:hypothetical protein